MAILAGEGYASEAVRTLLDKAQTGQDYTIFVLHDADPDGYNILRTISESTARMPNHNIEVIDLGLTVQDAIDLGINSEPFTRKKELAQDLSLNAIELEYFGGKSEITGNKVSWVCKRIELNALSAGQLVDYVDRGISRAIDAKGAGKKVIPPEEYLIDKANEQFRVSLESKVEQYIREKLNMDELVTGLSDSFDDVFCDQELTSGVIEYLDTNELETWSNSIDSVVKQKMDDLDADVQPLMAELFKNMVVL